MLEYCPGDMTPEQLAEWGKHQRPAPRPTMSAERVSDHWPCSSCKQLPGSHSDWCEVERRSLHEELAEARRELAAEEAGVPTQEPDKGAERWFDNGVRLNLYQAQKLVEYFGGDDTMVTIKFILPKPEYEIAGLCCWCSEYPEEGAELLSPSPPEEGHE